jgi:hypothetical protein
MHPPHNLAILTAWHKVEAVCRALFFVASRQRDAPKTFAGSSGVAWPWRRAKREKFLKAFAPRHRHCRFIFFITALNSFCHALRARTFT